MPGPFPGMDPYLENRFNWQSFHNRLMDDLEETLNASLPAPYTAFTEVRCYIERQEDEIRPDLVIQRQPVRQSSRSVAVLESADEPLHISLPQVENRETFVTIRDSKNHSRVVTLIELLSPSNKTTRNHGRLLYREKQEAILESDTHLIEIDLLREGKPTVALPLEMLNVEPPPEYVVCLHRGGAGRHYEVWPVRLREPLPRIRVPLDAGMEDIVLDLQTVLDQTYDRGNYARKTDYRQEPEPPLRPEDAAWADTLLREKGLR